MFKISLISAAFLLSFNAANAATFTIIDDFSTGQAEIETDVSTFPAGVGATAAGGGILGGKRGMRVVSQQAGNGFYTSSAVTNDFLVFSNSALDAGAVKLGYGGGLGLGGFDLTSAGQATEFVIDLISSDLQFGVLVRAKDTYNNVSTLRAAIMEIHGARAQAQLPELRLDTLNWWQGRRVRELCHSLYGDKEGAHATASELALTWGLFPERADRRVLDPQVAPIHRFQGPEDFRRNHPDGRMGSDPSLATEEDGRRLLELAIADVADAFRRFNEA